MLNIPLFTGFLAAALHVVSGPDHLAAVTPLALESRKKVWRIGFLWGLGHLLGMLLIGLLFLFFKEVIPIEKISEHSEQLVGVILILVGLWALIGVIKSNKKNTLQQNHQKSHKNKLWSSFAIGFLHGLAGVAHFILLLPVLGFNSQGESIQYILGFGVGTVLAMIAYTFVLGLLQKISKTRNNSFYQLIRVLGGLFAVIIGIYWLYLGF
jgi:cytochrome c biogenesis protein CcdA